MATWKKVVVSGSAISQLNNDAGYITSVTAQHAFTTASANGVQMLADGSQGNLTFASSSGAGLNISGNAGTDTLTLTLGSIPNSSLTNSAITIAGTSTSLGGSISQATILAGSGVFSGSAQIPNSSITNAQLANSSVTVGSTAISHIIPLGHG
jgi:microcystin-dependent protein